jgi:hypothetical protein
LHRILVGIPEGKRSLKDLVIEGKIIKWIVWKLEGRCGLDLSGSEYGLF